MAECRPARPPRDPNLLSGDGLHSPQPGHPESIPARPGKPRWLQRRAPVGERLGRMPNKQRQAAGVAGTRGGSLHIYSKRVPKLNVVYPDSGQVSKYSAATGHFSAARPSTRANFGYFRTPSRRVGRDGSGCPRVNVFSATCRLRPTHAGSRHGGPRQYRGRRFNEFEAILLSEVKCPRRGTISGRLARTNPATDPPA